MCLIINSLFTQLMKWWFSKIAVFENGGFFYVLKNFSILGWKILFQFDPAHLLKKGVSKSRPLPFFNLAAKETEYMLNTFLWLWFPSFFPKHIIYCLSVSFPSRIFSPSVLNIVMIGLDPEVISWDNEAFDNASETLDSDGKYYVYNFDQ